MIGRLIGWWARDPLARRAQLSAGSAAFETRMNSAWTVCKLRVS